MRAPAALSAGFGLVDGSSGALPAPPPQECTSVGTQITPLRITAHEFTSVGRMRDIRGGGGGSHECLRCRDVSRNHSELLETPHTYLHNPKCAGAPPTSGTQMWVEKEKDPPGFAHTGGTMCASVRENRTDASGQSGNDFEHICAR